MSNINHFGLSRSRNCDKNNKAVAPQSLDLKSEFPVVIEGAELLYQVCPVSKLTGNRASLYEAMQMLGNEKYSRALEALLPEIPSIMSDSRLSDDDRVSLLASRLNTGSPSENERLNANLAKIVDDFKDSFSAPVSKDSIQFNADDANVDVNSKE